MDATGKQREEAQKEALLRLVGRLSPATDLLSSIFFTRSLTPLRERLTDDVSLDSLRSTRTRQLRVRGYANPTCTLFTLTHTHTRCSLTKGPATTTLL